MYAKSRRKKFLIPAAILLLAVLGGGIWFAVGSGSEPVNVYPFQYIGMTEFWGDNQESYGPVTTDKIQTEFLSDTQTITEVAVKDGDMVKKGDVLFSFDTTLDALSLERKRLEVEKVKVQIKAAEERLQETREMVPYEPPKPTEPEKPDPETELKDPYRISKEIGNDKITAFDGKTKETALICWLKNSTPVTDDLLQILFDTAQNYQKESSPMQGTVAPEDEHSPESNASAVPVTTEDSQPENQQNNPPETSELTIKYVFTGKEPGVKTETEEIDETEYILDIEDFIDRNGETYWLTEARRPGDDLLLTAGELKVSGYPQNDENAQQEWENVWGEGIELKYTRDVKIEGKWKENDQLVSIPEDNPVVHLKVGQPAVFVIQSQIYNLDKETELKYSVSPADGIFKPSENDDQLFLMGTPEEVTTTPVKYTVTAEYSVIDSPWLVRETYEFFVSVESQSKKGEFHVVFKATEDNYPKGIRTAWEGAKVVAYDNGSFEIFPYDASGFMDHTLELDEEIEIDLPVIEPNHMYTAEEILDMQKQCYAIIKEQNEKLKLAETEYQIMERELGDGNVYAEIDGKVVSLLTEEEARQQKQPIVKVSGGGGFYIEGSVSELQRESLKLGQEVTINDWRNGGMYTGEVVSIGDFPSDNDNWNGMGNPTASYYPFKAFVSEDADLQAGSYVSMSYSTASAERGIYLEKAFVRTEKGNSYIFVRGGDGKLEKRPVKVGKVLWGSYYEILSPLGEEDCLAFPYGKNVKQGAPTVESDLNALYGY